MEYDPEIGTIFGHYIIPHSLQSVWAAIVCLFIALYFLEDIYSKFETVEGQDIRITIMDTCDHVCIHLSSFVIF